LYVFAFFVATIFYLNEEPREENESLVFAP